MENLTGSNSVKKAKVVSVIQVEAKSEQEQKKTQYERLSSTGILMEIC